MAQKVPIKNIDPVLVDIKNPRINYTWSSHHKIIDLRKTPMHEGGNSRTIKFILKTTLFAVLGVVALGIVFESFVLFQTKDVVKSAGEKIAQNFSVSVDAFQNLEPDKATAALKQNGTEIHELDAILENRHTSGFLSLLGTIIPTFREAGSLIKHVATLNMSFLKLAETTDTLKQDGFTDFQSNGEVLIEKMTRARNAINSILVEAQIIKNATTNLRKLSSFFDKVDSVVGEKYLAHSADLYRGDAAIEHFLLLVGSEKEKHIALFFQNPAEIRPGGGFIGSYADMTIQKGQMTNLDVRDIYDPDGQFFGKITPPYQLQTVSENWGARDANWFFDFPTSAKTVLGFLEESKMYSEKGITFDGAIAINIEVIETLLSVTGPIPLPEYNLTITSENFLPEVQREVEAGKDKAAGQPKKILKVLTPMLLEKLKGLDATGKTDLIKKFTSHIGKKDIMFYMKDNELSSFLNDAKANGALYEIPRDFWGSYLAVVDANIAGGKTDAFMTQAVSAEVNVDTSGSILTDVTVTRTHKGGAQKDPWWNADNKNFIQVLMNPGSNLVTMKGNTVKLIKPTFDYEANGYSKNPDLERIDSSRVALPGFNAWTMSEFGKTAFATWFTVAPKKTGTLTLRVHTDNTAEAPPEEGKKYTFVYERQSGVPTKLSVSVSAPVGFLWAESGTPLYTFTSDDVEGRTLFTLELKR
ncbi:MAG: DUF4012 domain-containing protein [Candidatus Paceibacterota bacterium]|jgi:hypothetical protein